MNSRGVEISIAGGGGEMVREPIVVAATFAYEDRVNPKPNRKPRTSTLAIHNPPPSRSEQVPKVNRVYREMPTQVWELFDTKMS